MAIPASRSNPSYDEDDDDIQRAIRISTIETNNRNNSNDSYSPSHNNNPNNNNNNKTRYKENDVRNLIGMGFTREQSIDALIRHNNNVQRAANHLLGHG